jgi:hypothetical protein
MRTAILLAAATLLAASAARAQDHGPVGVTMGFPGSVGIIWHLGDRVAVRPSISFSHSSTETGDDVPVPVPSGLGLPSNISLPIVRTRLESSGWTVGPGVDVLLTVARWDNVAAYVAPGYAYRRSSTETTITFEGFNFGGFVTPSYSETNETTIDSHEFSGLFGVRYTPHRRFGVFGEVGFRYSTTDSDGRLTSTRLTGTASAVGVIFYF